MNAEQRFDTSRRLLLAFYANDETANRVLRMALELNIAPDRISLLGKAGASGDDPLGIYYPNLGERMMGWGKMGALWGGIWGLVTGALGMFLIPGIGPVMAAGPVVEALIGALGGAGIGGGAMAGAAAISQIGIAVHRMGVPHETIQKLQRLLKEGHYLFMLIVDDDELERWRKRLEHYQPELVIDYPYVGFSNAVKQSL